MDKYDVKVAHKALYAPSAREFAMVEVPPLSYLAIDGHGDPNTSPAYAEAVEALYGVAYTLKFSIKKEQGRDFVVAPLEGLWRADDPAAFVTRDKASWGWTMLINQPDWVAEGDVASAVVKARAKKPTPALDELRMLRLDEGTCVQILHFGPYDDEGPTLHRLHHEFMPAHDLTFNGDHHEIYLSDPRRTEPAKLKTVLRQPVKPA
jgi:hypothetical protein